ncbi:Hsp20/alpha crystallin family protein [Metabacillus lacus]|uniref:Hsp20/alpha crystallin family protein n=1 Tax=Metabacillus lacus TaxID=1983721 RepID=UPI0031B593B5
MNKNIEDKVISQLPENLNFGDLIQQVLSSHPIQEFIKEIGEFASENLQFPYLDISTTETEEHYLIEAVLPNVNPQQVKVVAEGRYVTISIQQREEITEENSNTHYFRKSVTANSISRSVLLPAEVKQKDMITLHRDDTLLIKIPK